MASGTGCCPAVLAPFATACRTGSGVAWRTGMTRRPALQLVRARRPCGSGFLAGRRRHARELAAQACRAGGGLLPGPGRGGLHPPGQLGCLVPGPALHIGLGGQPFHCLAKLFAGSLNLLFQLPSVIGGRGLSVRLRRCFRRSIDGCGHRISVWGRIRRRGLLPGGLPCRSAGVIAAPFP